MANVARVATAMVAKARALRLPFRLKFAVGGPYEKAELTDRAMAPMVRALLPLRHDSEWLWDFHINGDARDLAFSVHKEPWTVRNITNAQYAASLRDNFTRWQAFFDEPAQGGPDFFRCGNFEQNGGAHDMSRALGNARNSVVLQELGDSVRMSTGANAAQLLGHNDNGWDQVLAWVARSRWVGWRGTLYSHRGVCGSQRRTEHSRLTCVYACCLPCACADHLYWAGNSDSDVLSSPTELPRAR